MVSNLLGSNHEIDKKGYGGNLLKVVIVANLFGQSAKMNELMVICDTYGLPLFKDASESLFKRDFESAEAQS